MRHIYSLRWRDLWLLLLLLLIFATLAWIAFDTNAGPAPQPESAFEFIVPSMVNIFHRS